MDVLPTILDVLEAKPETDFEGRSLRAEPDPQRGRVISAGGGDGVIELDSSIRRDLAREAARRRELLGLDRRNAPHDLFHVAPSGTQDLIGVSVDEVEVGREAPFSADLKIADAYEDVDPEGPVVPTLVGGDLDLRLPDDAHVTIAVAVNGRIGGVTRTVNRGARQRGTEFVAMVDPRLFRKGSNDMAFYVVETGSDGEATLLPVPMVD